MVLRTAVYGQIKCGMNAFVTSLHFADPSQFRSLLFYLQMEFTQKVSFGALSVL